MHLRFEFPSQSNIKKPKKPKLFKKFPVKNIYFKTNKSRVNQFDILKELNLNQKTELNNNLNLSINLNLGSNINDSSNVSNAKCWNASYKKTVKEKNHFNVLAYNHNMRDFRLRESNF